LSFTYSRKHTFYFVCLAQGTPSFFSSFGLWATLSGLACLMQYLGFCLVYNFKHFVPSAGYNHSTRCAERFKHTALSMVRTYIYIRVSGIWGMTLSVTVKGSLPPLVNNNVPREPNWKSICSHYINYLPLKMTFILC
jgi:hypothetical protein